MEMRRLHIDETLRRKLDKLIKKRAKKHKVQGVSVVVTDKHSNLYENYHGVVDEEGTHNSDDKKMMIGSTTKLLTALGILVLKDRGELKLDDDIKKHLKSFAIKSRFRDYTITIRDLMMHVSGIPSDDFDLITRKDKPLSSILESLANETMCARPRTMYAYSNLGYGLLGLIIETVSRKPYVDFMEEEIFEKLDVTFEFLHNSKMLEERKKAISQSFTASGKIVEDPLGTTISGGSSTYGKLSDLAKLLRFFLNNNEIGLIKKATFAEMMKRPEGEWTCAEDIVVGLGLMHDMRHFYGKDIGPVKGHGGNTIYHHSTFEFMSEEGFGVAVMTNSARGGVMSRNLTKDIMVHCLEQMGKRVPKKENPPAAIRSHHFDKHYVAISNKLMTSEGKMKKHSRLSFLKFIAKENDDGYIKPFPIGLARLPFIRKALHSIRFLPANINGERILYVEQRLKHFRRIISFFSEYEERTIPKSWLKACDKYQVIGNNKDLKNLFKKVRLKHKKGDLVLEMNALGSKNRYYLLPLNEKEAIIQGFGRGAKSTVALDKKSGRVQLNVYGITLEPKA